MAETVYALCALTSAGCAALLLRGHLATRARLLFWGAACFAGLALNNVILCVDLILVPSVDLSLVRGLVALVAMLVLLVGLVWESK